MNTHKKQHNPKQKQREKRNYIFCTYHKNTRLNKTMSRPCKICTLHWIPDRPDDHSCSRSWLRYNVFFLQSKKKKDGDADISETDLVSDNINPLHGKLLSLQLQSSITIIFDRDRKKRRRGSQWNCLKLATWFGSVAADISVLPLRKKIYLTNK